LTRHYREKRVDPMVDSYDSTPFMPRVAREGPPKVYPVPESWRRKT